MTTFRTCIFQITLSLLLAVASIMVFFRQPESAVVSDDATFEQIELTSANPLPAIGAEKQFGVYLYDNQMAREVNASLGANKLKLFGLFEHWSPEGIANNNKLTSICSAGFTPLISWESWEGKNSQVVYELEDITTGKYDDVALAFFDDLQRTCQGVNVIVRFDHEMEMRPTYGYPWTPWQGKPDVYAKAWRHVINLARTNGYNTIKWPWSPNRADQYIYDYYPGDDYVDYVGMTLNHPTVTGMVYGSFGQFYAPNKRYLESFNKPIIIGEAAYYNTSEESVAKWIDGTFDYVKNDDKVVALVWFNQNLSHLNYGLEATTLGKDAFIRNMKAQ